MLRPKKESYKEFHNEKNSCGTKFPTPPPLNFSNGPSLSFTSREKPEATTGNSQASDGTAEFRKRTSKKKKKKKKKQIDRLTILLCGSQLAISLARHTYRTSHKPLSKIT